MDLGKDIALFASTVFVNFSLFLLLQALFFNALRISRLFTALSRLAMISTAITAVLTWLVFQGMYSSIDAWVLGTLGGITTFFGIGALSVLLGPASVDRSVTAHILIYLARAPNEELMDEELILRYNGTMILQKRFEEMQGVGAITRHEGNLKLTGKGRRLAVVYMWIIKIFRLDERIRWSGCLK